MLAIPVLALFRVIFLIFDILASAFYGTCSRGCNLAPLSGCEGLLGFIAVLNFFSVGALVLIGLIRWNTEERAYAEALVVTTVLVMIDTGLKIGDIGTPITLAVVCFPKSITAPIDTPLSSRNCAKPCPIGELYSVYAIYVILKSLVGIIDVVLNTGFLLNKPRDWYRLRGTHAR